MNKKVSFPSSTLLLWCVKYIKPIEISQGNRLYQKSFSISSRFYFVYFCIGKGRRRKQGERRLPRGFPPASASHYTRLPTKHHVISWNINNKIEKDTHKKKNCTLGWFYKFIFFHVIKCSALLHVGYF